MLKQYSPLIELLKLQDELNRLMTDLSSQISVEPLYGAGGWIPNVDLSEDREQIVVQVEVPGVAANHLKVAFQAGYLQISGEKKTPLQKGEAHYLCLERNYGKFCRTMFLNSAIDLDNAKARLHNGILTILLPKLTDRRKLERVIPIE